MCYLAVIHNQKREEESISEDELVEVLREHRYYRKLIRAIEEHSHKDEMGFLHSSLIVRGGNILSIGINLPSQNGFCRTYTEHNQTQIHSEFSAINQIRRKVNVRGATMYNCRMNRHGMIRMSKPCPSCEKMLRNYGLKKVVYTTDAGIKVMKLRG